MKPNKSVLLILFVFICMQSLSSQVDTNLVNQYYEKALVFENAKQLDSAIFYYNETNKSSLQLPKEYEIWSAHKLLNSLNKVIYIYIVNKNFDKAMAIADSVIAFSEFFFSKDNSYNSLAYHYKGYILAEKYDNLGAIDNWLKCLSIRINLYGENNKDVATSYNNLGNTYSKIAQYDKALEFVLKSLEIRKNIYGEINSDVAWSYNTLGSVYYYTSEYDKALDNFYKSLTIRKQLFGETHKDVAISYNSIGAIYEKKVEYDKALEYLFKSLDIRKELYGEKNILVATLYNNIGGVFYGKGDRERALEYHKKSLDIRKELLGEKHLMVAQSYINIGLNYSTSFQYEKALENYFKGLKIQTDLLGSDNLNVAWTYFNIGDIYLRNKEHDKALEYIIKSLAIRKKLVGDFHGDIANTYYNLGRIYNLKRDSNSAISYFQKAIAACLRDYSDTADIYKTPKLKPSLHWKFLLQSITSKAELMLNKRDFSNNEVKKNFKIIVLNHYQVTDTLINLIRKDIKTEKDKMLIGEFTNKVYDGAIQVCLQLAQLSEKKQAEEYNQLAFYFSEKNKSQVLLQALSGQEAQKFAGIPDSLLEKERGLKVDINLYEQKLSEGQDSITERNFRDKLFNANRQYEDLISNFEASYPEYFNLKYSTKNPSVNDLQKLLDAKTAVRSYFVGDSVIYIFTISNKKFDVQQVAKIDNLEDTIRYFRYGLTKFSERMTDIYRRTGVLLYQQLFPENSVLDEKIENLIIIPDGALATIPFEALLTNNMATIATDDFKNYPFLINRYNVSYSYSANLFYRTFPKKKKKQPELTNINDWLALAPVFDDKSEQGIMLATRELQKQINNLQTDSLNVRGRLLTGDYITPLPGTESETQAIIKEYENRNLKAQALLHNSANEQFIKSGGLEKYKVLHFATHGFVNSEKPELSGILLAQDRALSEHCGARPENEVCRPFDVTFIEVLTALLTGGKQRVLVPYEAAIPEHAPVSFHVQRDGLSDSSGSVHKREILHDNVIAGDKTGV